MKTWSTDCFIPILWCLGILIVIISACKTTSVTDLPAAETPILETVLDIDKNLIVPYHALGVFEISPGGSLRRLEHRLRAIFSPQYLRSISSPQLGHGSPDWIRSN